MNKRIFLVIGVIILFIMLAIGASTYTITHSLIQKEKEAFKPQIENISEYVPAFKRELDKITDERKEEILEAAEILIKYEGYIGRERIIADKLARLESIKIKGKFDYDSLQSLSTEARQKLKKIDPETIAQASRIPGVSPSDINVLLVLSGR